MPHSGIIYVCLIFFSFLSILFLSVVVFLFLLFHITFTNPFFFFSSSFSSYYFFSFPCPPPLPTKDFLHLPKCLLPPVFLGSIGDICTCKDKITNERKRSIVGSRDSVSHQGLDIQTNGSHVAVNTGGCRRKEGARGSYFEPVSRLVIVTVSIPYSFPAGWNNCALLLTFKMWWRPKITENLWCKSLCLEF